MKKKTTPIYLVLIVDLLLFFTSNCSNRESEKENLEPLKLPPSFVSFDIDLPIQELEESINAQIKTVLMDDVLDLNKKGDKLFLKIEKNGPLKLNLRQDRVYASIPFTSKVAVKKKVMGMTFSNKDVPIEFAGIAEVKASASLDSLWNFSLKGEDFNISWTSDPSFDIMGVKFDLLK